MTVTAAKIIDNKIVQLIEISNEDEKDLQNFINNQLNLDGEWVSTKPHFEKYDYIPPVESTYDRYLNIFIPPKPYDSWILTNSMTWTAPKANILRNPRYGYEKEMSSGPSFYWDEEYNSWAHYWVRMLFEEENKRTNGFYFVYKCTDVKDISHVDELHDYINVKCRPACFDYHEVHPDWDENYIDPIFRPGSYAEQYGSSISNPYHSYIYGDFKVVYDAAPHFRIMHAYLCDVSKGPDEFGQFPIAPELEEEHLKQHPQIAARNLVELFKLIIDWDLAYHYFDNRENIAILCHNIMATINMPNDIYNEIATDIKDSPVSRYIKGDENALNNYSERQLASPKLIKWFKDKYFEMPHLKTHEILNINTYIDDHYHL